MSLTISLVYSFSSVNIYLFVHFFPLWEQIWLLSILRVQNNNRLIVDAYNMLVEYVNELKINNTGVEERENRDTALM